MDLTDNPADGQVRFPQEFGSRFDFPVQNILYRRNSEHFFPFPKEYRMGIAVRSGDFVQPDLLIQMLLEPNRYVSDSFRVRLVVLPICSGIKDFPVQLETDPVYLIRRAGRIQPSAKTSEILYMTFDFVCHKKRFTRTLRIQPQFPEFFQNLG